jgi:MtN3 and saliva related transmembrane protein
MSVKTGQYVARLQKNTLSRGLPPQFQQQSQYKPNKIAKIIAKKTFFVLLFNLSILSSLRLQNTRIHTMALFIDIVNVAFGMGLFLNACLFIPQAIKLYRKKCSTGVSLTTFAGFCFIQIVSIIYGLAHHDDILFVGFLISFVTCLTVTILIIKYRRNPVVTDKE